VLGKLNSLLSWLSKQAIARVLSYTRQLERQLAAQDRIYLEQIRLVRDENQAEIKYLRKEIEELKAERQALLDRLLYKNGFKPVWHQEEPKEKPKPTQYQPAYEAAIEEAEVEHTNFKSMLDAAKTWKTQSQGTAE